LYTLYKNSIVYNNFVRARDAREFVHLLTHTEFDP